jgi:hypothetical protein
MADATREERRDVEAMNVEEQKEAVEGADNAIARRLREMQFRAARPAPVTPAEPQNTPTALAVKACRERDEVAAARDAVPGDPRARQTRPRARGGLRRA